MASYNPFISITYSKDDTIVDRVNERIELLILLNEAMDHGGVIILKGAPGMGKSTLIGAVQNELEKSSRINIIKEEFTPTVYNEIRGIENSPEKKTLIILDDFNNIEMLDRLSQQKVIDMVYKISQNIAVMLIENRDEGVEKELETQGKLFKKLTLGGLSKEDIKQVILNRLNIARKTKSDSLSPFNPIELDKIYKKAKGNPRITLLICSALYDQKTNTII